MLYVGEEMCRSNNLETDAFCENWLAYKFSNQKHQEMNATSLEAFGRYVSGFLLFVHFSE